MSEAFVTEGSPKEQPADLASRVDLIGLRFSGLSGFVQKDQPFRPESIEVGVSRTHKTADSGFECKHRFDMSLRGSEPDKRARIRVEVVSSFAVVGDGGYSKDDVATFVDAAALYVVLPYVREAIQSMSVRLGIGPVTLGLIQQRDGKPTVTTATVGRFADDE